jgi:hypothetical protein
MAGDWIKLEMATPDKPEVIAMASGLRIDQDAVTGKLIRIWVWADMNSVDGAEMSITDAFIDRLTNKRGFARAMRAAGWLTGPDGACCFPGFSRHNGTTAKARAENNRRVTDHRERNKNVTPEALQKPLPEKRREEKSKREREGARAAADLPVIPEEVTAAVNGLRSAWSAVPGWTANEKWTAAENIEALASISQENWGILKRYLGARLREGDPGWQPQSRLKFLESPGDVLSHGLRWAGKQPLPPAKPKPQQSPPAEPAEALNREEIREALRIVV